jgi:DNA-binding NarL/FixJ family response regulator
MWRSHSSWRSAIVTGLAAQLNITSATARTHAILIFAKTGTERQTELNCRFFEMIVPRPLPSA